jgi:hypothetical protein
MIHVWNSLHRFAFRNIAGEMKNTHVKETNSTFLNACKISKLLINFLPINQLALRVAFYSAMICVSFNLSG